MKKITALLLCLAVLTLNAGAGLAESTPLVYEVKDGEGHTLYLLGTIHVGGADMYPLSEAVWTAYEAADVLAVEIDLVAQSGGLLASIRTVAALMYGLGDNAKKHLSPETYALGVEKLGVPEILLKRMRPAAWYSLAENYVIQAAGLDATLGVDYTLLNRAYEDKKPIVELEGMDEQMETLLDLPEDVLDADIWVCLTYPEEAGQSLRALYEAWCRGGEEELLAVLTAEEEAEMVYEEELFDEFSDILITDRNARFEEQAVAFLQSGETVLIAIGALHIIGEDGLAGRLAKLGYEVTEIGR